MARELARAAEEKGGAWHGNNGNTNDTKNGRRSGREAGAEDPALAWE